MDTGEYCCWESRFKPGRGDRWDVGGPFQGSRGEGSELSVGGKQNKEAKCLEELAFWPQPRKPVECCTVDFGD